MSNEGPQRTDFTQASVKPTCGASCEHKHGDQGYTDDELELFALRTQIQRGQALVEQMVSLQKQVVEDNGMLRRLLFLRHGCSGPALYGDDGEMQCKNCGIDFRRDMADEIETKWQLLGLEKMVRQIPGYEGIPFTCKWCGKSTVGFSSSPNLCNCALGADGKPIQVKPSNSWP